MGIKTKTRNTRKSRTTTSSCWGGGAKEVLGYMGEGWVVFNKLLVMSLYLATPAWSSITSFLTKGGALSKRCVLPPWVVVNHI